MKVDIADLRVRLNNYANPDAHVFQTIAYELNEALNELEELRRYRNDVRTTEMEIARLTQDLARVTAIKDRLIVAGNAMRDELTGRAETTSFKKWFKNLHPDTIESITFNLRKKESN